MRTAPAIYLLLVAAATKAQPMPPQLLYPENGGTRWASGDLIWSAVAGAVAYRAQVAVAGSDFGDVVFDEATPDTLLSNLLPLGPLEWRVAAFDGTVWSDWSEVWVFECLFPFPNEPLPAPRPALTIESIHPNPSEGMVVLRVRGTSGRPALLRIYDAAGRAATQFEVHPSADVEEIRWDASEFAPGLYLLHIQSEEGAAWRAVTLMR